MDRKAAVLTAFICIVLSSVGGQSPASSPTATPAPPTTTAPPPVSTPPPVATPSGAMKTGSMVGSIVLGWAVVYSLL
ncbi:hypothetical protein E3N88_27856 [Mikania micrantha]|uniref:Arabinogalactan protein n=1 Tax=Mikania micrantha TaxID=192012 RepID=A0A5N6N0P4_9ASTR|nr:hypothetical protein E3N88_27856 [Mikania micrantha]